MIKFNSIYYKLVIVVQIILNQIEEKENKLINN